MLDVIRKRAVHAKALPLGLHWVMLVIAGVLFALVATFVDLRPVVDENFFFSTSDPGIQQTKKIEHQFPSQPEVILTVSSRDISSSRYLGRIQKLTQRVHSIGGASAVKSLAEGPKSFEDAIKSPFWSRLLIATDRKASNVIIFMKGRHTETPIRKLEQIVHELSPIRKLEQIVHELDAHDFRIHIAGPPYVVEMLRRSLEHDFRYFTLTAIVLFGSDDGGVVPVRPIVRGNALHLCERRLVDVTPPIHARPQDRDPDGQPRYHRVHRGVVAPRLHDLQLADAGRSSASHRKGVARSGAGCAADDVFAFALVDGLRVIRLCQLADCTGETVARVGIWRPARQRRRVRLCVFDVSGVPALGRATQKAKL